MDLPISLASPKETLGNVLRSLLGIWLRLGSSTSPCTMIGDVLCRSLPIQSFQRQYESARKSAR